MGSIKSASKQKNKLFAGLVIIFIIHFLFRVGSYWQNYTIPFDGEYWTKRYNESQWVIGDSKNPIGDDGLYTYEAWAYIQGANPVLLNAEVPFFGKYLLGGVIILFKNQNIFGLLTGIFALISFYLLNLKLFKSKLIAFIPVALFSFERLFYEQLRAPFFDLLQLSFLFLGFLFALNKRYILTAICLGFFASTKFSFMVVLPVVTITLYYAWIRLPKLEWLKYFLSLSLVFFVYLATYWRYFLLGNSLWDFLGVQKWIYTFYTIGAKTPAIGSIFTMIFAGQWRTHWGETLGVDEWWIVWPILMVISFVSFFIVFKNSNIEYRNSKWFHRLTTGKTVHTVTQKMFLLQLWVVVYLAFLMFVPTFPRYLLLILPFLYNLFIWICLENTHVKRFLRLA